MNPTGFGWPAGPQASFGVQPPARTELAAALEISLMPLNISLQLLDHRVEQLYEDSMQVCTISCPMRAGVLTSSAAVVFIIRVKWEGQECNARFLYVFITTTKSNQPYSSQP